MDIPKPSIFIFYNLKTFPKIGMFKFHTIKIYSSHFINAYHRSYEETRAGFLPIEMCSPISSLDFDTRANIFYVIWISTTGMFLHFAIFDKSLLHYKNSQICLEMLSRYTNSLFF